MIAIVIPARNEAERIEQCLRAAQVAARHPGLHQEAVLIIVAADSCTDGTAQLARPVANLVIEGDFGDVGSARAAAAEQALHRGARWLANTDADSVVPADWLAAQLAYGSDAFCGIVGVGDWEDYSASVSEAFQVLTVAAPGHPHVHGANLGVAADAYVRAGGFQPGAAHEDVSLVKRLAAIGAVIARQPSPRVMTSARRSSRAREGFSDYLKALEAGLLRSPAAVGPSGTP
ncbi:glycosyltransferase [Lysobacter sp. H23M47]|uniref:glycosyltransferase n=1 Tax=Lysobacter sp. H23M47 TaxID=2781024 RepID=UPI00187E61DD|nr:glycosyltransferase [Lysobacter sp. H23M47]QOW24425.1 glycosyltransferase [Lysobacter sp. H23M47]